MRNKILESNPKYILLQQQVRMEKDFANLKEELKKYTVNDVKAAGKRAIVQAASISKQLDDIVSGIKTQLS